MRKTVESYLFYRDAHLLDAMFDLEDKDRPPTAVIGQDAAGAPAPAAGAADVLVIGEGGGSPPKTPATPEQRGATPSGRRRKIRGTSIGMS